MPKYLESSGPKRKHQILSREAFDHLLRALDADRDRAGEKYELLRRKLIKFFEWRGALNPQDLADQTLNIVADKLAQGERIQSFGAYCCGVGRMVLLEKSRESSLEDALRAEARIASDATETGLGDVRQDCLEKGLQQLPVENRELILTYYRDDKRAKIETRRALAERLGLPLNALRIRVHRIRAKLEESVRECVERSEQEK